MTGTEILARIKEQFGFVPGWLSGMPEDQLQLQWSNINWLMSDSKLSSREKALVSFGAAGAIHCPY